MDDSTEREGRVVATIPADTFEHRLMLARSHAGRLTIFDAATRCGLSPQSWSNWEKGMKPRDVLEITDAIAEGLDIDRNWLRDGGPLPKPERQIRRKPLRKPYSGSSRPGTHARRPRRLNRHRVPA